ncbi:uncharacterized protein DUF4342 [Anaerospora hongkongensis]|uniref:Uncharacterized protein DUF4342 n=1 Tax=Anaerospora hongkongensis TaxID=244830 RepID=A0A4R1PX79_9FIRM|nr:DUF4342 domain-containing protein [Anaerospora hongkongensis]TCL35001.1 uncharacterized protein DUF4342 [Anaerospora hongkongensis]
MEEITLEKIDIIRDRTGISYREAQEALERNQGNIISTLIDLENTKETSWTEEFSVRSGEVIDKVKELIHEGNVTKVRVKHDGRTLVDIPVTLGTIGAVVLPQLAALGVLVAVFKRCTIEVVRSEEPAENEVEKEEFNEEEPIRDRRNDII